MGVYGRTHGGVAKRIRNRDQKRKLRGYRSTRGQHHHPLIEPLDLATIRSTESRVSQTLRKHPDGQFRGPGFVTPLRCCRRKG